MSDPPRLLSPESQASDFERRLLTAWGDERPPPGARDATLAALGLGPPGASALALTKLAKWTLLVLGLGAPVVVALSRGHAPEERPAARVETPPREQTSISVIHTTSTISAPQTASRTSSPAVRNHPRPAVAPDTLPAEIAALDGARAALRNQQPAKALALLDGYDGNFPHGALREEASVVRIEALVVAGEMDEARRRTDAFTSSHPTSPHVARLRRLLLEP